MQATNSSQSEKSGSKLKDELSKSNDLFTENTQLNDLLGETDQKEKIMRIMMIIKYFSTMKICKEDNQPIELIDNLFIGSKQLPTNKVY